MQVFGEPQIEDLLQKCFNYNEEDVRKLITLTLAKQKTTQKTLQSAAFSNLPQQSAEQGIGNHEMAREFKRRKVHSWIHYRHGTVGNQKKYTDANLEKLRVLDVKIVQ